MAAESTPRLRLVKVVVQAHFVLDDGEFLTEQVANPVEVPAAQWPTYATEQFPADVEAALARLIETDPSAEA
jgi:hypothetical protein